MSKNLIIIAPSGNLSRTTEAHWSAIVRRLLLQETTIVRIPFEFTERETKDQKAYRLNELYPLLQSKLIEGADNQLIVMGGIGAKAVFGYDPSETSMVGKTRLLDGWTCACTYGLPYYQDDGEKGGHESAHILEHIDTTIKAALREPFTAHWTSGPFAQVAYDWSELVVDIESNGLDLPYYGTQMSVIGLRPVGSDINFLLRPSEVTDLFRDLLHQQVRKVIGHNVGFDILFLKSVGIEFPHARLHDTMIFHKNFNPNEQGYELKPLLKRDYAFSHYDAWFSQRIQNSKHKKDPGLLLEYSEEDFKKLCMYNCGDLEGTEKIYLNQVQPQNFATVRVPFSVEMDYLPYVLRMIHNGMKVDIGVLNKISEDTGESLGDADQVFREKYQIGDGFNLDAPAQVCALLNEYGIRVTSTRKEVLEKYKDSHEIVNNLLNIRNLSKLLRTSTGNSKNPNKTSKKKSFKSYIDKDGLVHSSVSVHGAETGRDTSSAPNLQNTDPRVRECFVSRYPGGRLLNTDLSGIEYRLIGHVSQDRILLDVFNTGKDIHDEMYKFLFHVPPPDKILRKKAKTANFCGVYGGGYKKFIVSAGLEDNRESRRLYEAAKTRYRGVLEWKKAVEEQLRSRGFVKSIFGRVRHFASFPNVSDSDVREAVNWMIQSSGHDVLKIYSMELNDRLQDAGLSHTLMVNEVHDSNVYDSPSDEYEHANLIITGLGKDLNPLIEQCYGVKMRVPIFAETELLERWA